MQIFKRCIHAALFGLAIQTPLWAETIGIFADTTIGQIKFASGDVKAALELKGFTVEINPLGSLSSSYANKKVVIALATNTAVAGVLTAQGGVMPTGMTEQSNALRTTTMVQKSFWAFGGDINGAMYGGLQVADNIKLSGFTGTYDSQEKPFLLNRGMKLNLPLDSTLPTYVGAWSSVSAQKAIPHVWDEAFWKTLIDAQARFRYNMLSVWLHNPFPALVDVPAYPLATLPSITGYKDGYKNAMNITQRIAFWQKIMKYAHERGMSFYFFNWNIYTDYAKTKYTLPDHSYDSKTKDYLQKSLAALIDTYPDLDGFGISAGDGMPNGSATNEKTDWTWDVYGQTVKNYLTANPSRKFTLIHRGLATSFDYFKTKYAPLKSMNNARVQYSIKYAQAHMYSTPTPRWSGDIDNVATGGGETYLTCRNEDFFYLNWGDPKFVRDFLAGIPYKESVIGIYLGSDGFNPSRTYFCKNKSMNNQLEVERKSYMEMLWGRLGYNPKTGDDVLTNYLAMKYPAVASPTNLFKAWSLASRPLTKVTELVQGTWQLDFNWYPEMCSGELSSRGGGFKTIEAFAGADIAEGSNEGSNLCNISNSAKNNCGSTKSAYILADEMQKDADEANNLINSISDGGNAEAAVAVENVKQLTYLSQYYAYKIRGATFKQSNQEANAREAMGKAYCWWMNYINSMDKMYEATSYRNVSITPNMHYVDAAVLKEYTDLKGTGTPSCPTVDLAEKKSAEPLKNLVSLHSLTTHGMVIYLPESNSSKISIFSNKGERIIYTETFKGIKGLNKISFSKPIAPGAYLVRIEANKLTTVIKNSIIQE